MCSLEEVTNYKKTRLTYPLQPGTLLRSAWRNFHLKLASQSINRSLNQSVDRSVGQLASQSIS